jgi:teichoic acid transport system permease protein
MSDLAVGTEAGPIGDRPSRPPEPIDYQALALRHGLAQSGARPPLLAYLRELWARRYFILAFARAKLTSQYSEAKLGQIWQVATPLLNAAVFYLVFGVLLQAKRGVPDYIPFLVTGVFIWTYTNSCVIAGVRAVSGNIGLVRALHFPRASLPLALCIQQFQQLLFSLIVLFAILLGFGVPPTWHWVFLIPAIAMQTMFNVGMALIVARAGSRTPDLAQLLPFLMRTWMYMSGVMYSLEDKLKHAPHALQVILPKNPTAVYIDLIRYSLIKSFGPERLVPHVWALSLGWGVVVLAIGFVFFWRAEEVYGRG